MKTKKLNPCPFCGGNKPKIVLCAWGTHIRVECEACGANGPMCKRKDWAVSKWNKPTPLPAALKEKAVLEEALKLACGFFQCSVCPLKKRHKDFDAWVDKGCDCDGALTRYFKAKAEGGGR